MKAVIFDRDGVLIDSENIHKISVKEAFAQLGIILTKEEVASVVARHYSDYIPEFEKKYSFDRKKYFLLQQQEYEARREERKIINPAVTLLKSLAEQGVIIGICTSASSKGTHKLIHDLNLTEYVQAIITDEECSQKKPSPEPYQKMAKKLSLPPQECIVIEDSEIGVLSATRAGMKCIAIPNEHTKKQDFSQATMVLTSADEITMDVLRRV